MQYLTIGGVTVPTRRLPAALIAEAEESARVHRTTVRLAVDQRMRENGERRIGSVHASDRMISNLIEGIDRKALRETFMNRLPWIFGAVFGMLYVGPAMAQVWAHATGVMPTFHDKPFAVSYTCMMLGLVGLLLLWVTRPSLDRIDSLVIAIVRGAAQVAAGEGRIYLGSFAKGEPVVREIRYDAIGNIVREDGHFTFVDRLGERIFDLEDAPHGEPDWDARRLVEHVRARLPA